MEPVAAWLALKVKVVQTTPGCATRESTPTQSSLPRSTRAQKAPASFIERKLKVLASGEPPVQLRINRAHAVQLNSSFHAGGLLAKHPVATKIDVEVRTSGILTDAERSHLSQRMALLQRSKRLRRALRKMQQQQIEHPPDTAAVVFANILRETSLHHHRRRLAELDSDTMQGATSAMLESAKRTLGVLEQVNSADEDETGSAVSKTLALLDASRIAREQAEAAALYVSTADDEQQGFDTALRRGTVAAGLLEDALHSTRETLLRAREAGFA